jgi:hypothetical protein
MTEQFGTTVPLDGVRSRQGNLFLGILAGIIAAAIGAGVWMGITIATNMHLGLVAIAVGAFVGFAVRIAGNGTSFCSAWSARFAPSQAASVASS